MDAALDGQAPCPPREANPKHGESHRELGWRIPLQLLSASIPTTDPENACMNAGEPLGRCIFSSRTLKAIEIHVAFQALCQLPKPKPVRKSQS